MKIFNLFKLARKIMGYYLLKDEDLYDSYKASISICIYDSRNKEGRLNINDCNLVAEKLINLIFD